MKISEEETISECEHDTQRLELQESIDFYKATVDGLTQEIIQLKGVCVCVFVFVCVCMCVSFMALVTQINILYKHTHTHTSLFQYLILGC